MLANLRRLGWRVDASSEFNREHDAVVVCGGDGTLHRALQPLAAAAACGDPAPLLGIAPPWGSANIVAHTLGCPRSPAPAAGWLDLAWRQGGRTLPLGTADTGSGRRYFLAVAGVGYDAAIVAGMDAAAKRRWGKLAFGARALTHWRRYFPAPMELEYPGGACTADGVLFSLSRYYAGRLRLGAAAPGERARVLVLTGAPRLLPLQALALCSIGLNRAPGVVRLPAAELTIPTPDRPLQLDGEAAGVTPVRLGLETRGIRFLAPP